MNAVDMRALGNIAGVTVGYIAEQRQRKVCLIGSDVLNGWIGKESLGKTYHNQSNDVLKKG